MDWDRRRFDDRRDDRRGGESYRPADRPGRSPSRGFDARHRRSPPRNRSHLRADTWVPSARGYGRPRSRSPPDYRRRSRTPPFQGRGYGPAPYGRRRSPRRFSPRRDDRPRSPPASWRSKSPHSEGRSRDVSRGRSSPGRNREPSPGGQESRLSSRNAPLTGPIGDRNPRGLSPKTQPNLPARPSSPSHTAIRREMNGDFNRGQPPPSRPRQFSPNLAHRPASSTTSRRSSPTMDLDRNNQHPLRSRSRSPARPSPPHRPSADRGPMSIDGSERDIGESDQPRFGANVPTQPRGLGGRQSPPTGPSHGPRGIPPHRGSQNLSVLSAPTRPRRGHGSRDGPWSSGPMPRRGPISSTPHGPPSGPRASFSSGMPGGNFRHPGSRQNSTVSGPPPALPVPKPPGHLAGLATVIPAGRVLPSGLDPVAEKRLAQLEADHERLLQQMAETQRQKRAGLRDWDRLDHESSICALKSELADGHLQRMADEAIGGGVPF